MKVAYFMKFSAVTPVPKSVTTAIDQTLTCSIEGLTVSPKKYPVSVTWKDPDGTEILPDNANYVIKAGTLDDSGTQLAELTIKPVQLRKLASLSTFQCSVQSGQYPSSPRTYFHDVKVTVQKALGKSPTITACVVISVFVE